MSSGYRGKEYVGGRNRIIAGLSDVLYVIDAGAKSGANTTIKAAQRYGKEIFRSCTFIN